MRTKLLIGAAALVAAMALPAVTATAAGASGTSPDPNQATVMLAKSPYGQILVVGGAGAGYIPATQTTPAHYIFPTGTSLYSPSIDPPTYKASGQPYKAGCTTVVHMGTSQGNISCTGAETDPQADWPALTTDAPPVSGPGIDPRQLGSVYRTDLGTYQVTYGGHPLYLFDPGPHSYFGANFYETLLPLPPEHTAWYLISRAGLPATGPATIETEAPQPGTTYTSTKLAVEMLPNVVPGGAAVSAYSFSLDTPTKSACYAVCSRLMIPVYTVGAPVIGSGVNASAVGTITRPNGVEQVTYNGMPLYIYSQEQPLAGPGGLGTTGSAGNGDGVTAKGGPMKMTGSFSLVTP
jgi:predicted lipoprotein with Yx(FWY)xxD motif